MYVCVYIYMYICITHFSICSVCISILDVLNAFIILTHASLYLSLSLSPVDPLQTTYYLYVHG